MDITTALDYLESHTNYEGWGANKGPTPPMPTAGDTEGLGLGSIRELMTLLGDPHEAYRVIHVTGTNGKGSTCRFTSSLLAATGLSVGTFTSPNIERINERITYDGTVITNEDLARVLTLLADLEPMLSSKPSRWDLLTTAAFVWFAELGIDVAVVEVGLLGRFDSTNVVTADVAVITNVGKDHTDGAEGWRDKVAGEKAGIVKPGSHLILGEPMPSLRPIIDREPRRDIWEAGTDFIVTSNLPSIGGRVINVETPGTFYEQLHVPFHGEHQGDNAATALATVEAFLGRPLDQDLVDEALSKVDLPARFEVAARYPTIILDGAHNPPGALAAKATLDTEFARLGSWVLVVGLLVGKDPAEMLEALGARDFDAVIVTQPDSPRAVSAEDLGVAATEMGISVEIIPNAGAALARARAVTADDDLILVAGSLYLVGEIRAAARSVITEGSPFG